MRVLGLDPSSQSTGFGIIDYDARGCTVLAFGTIRPQRRLPFHKKLNEIQRRLEDLIATHHPDEVAIENPFYARNIKTAIALGQVRGAVLVAVASADCSLHEYSALEIKKAVTGYGQAGKDQVQMMVRMLLHIDSESLEPDASDALATAYCHLNTRLYERRLEAGPEGEPG